MGRFIERAAARVLAGVVVRRAGIAGAQASADKATQALLPGAVATPVQTIVSAGPLRNIFVGNDAMRR